jgi:hypothetical protein
MKRRRQSDVSGLRASEPTFTLKEAAKLVGVPLRRLRGWLDKGVLRGTLPAPRRGVDRRVTASDLVRLSAMASLQRLFGARNLRLGTKGATVGRFLADWRPTDQVPTLNAEGIVIFSALDARSLVVDFLPTPEDVAARLAQLTVAVVVNLTAMHNTLHARS